MTSKSLVSQLDSDRAFGTDEKTVQSQESQEGTAVTAPPEWPRALHLHWPGRGESPSFLSLQEVGEGVGDISEVACVTATHDIGPPETSLSLHPADGEQRTGEQLQGRWAGCLSNTAPYSPSLPTCPSVTQLDQVYLPLLFPEPSSQREVHVC